MSQACETWRVEPGACDARGSQIAAAAAAREALSGRVRAFFGSHDLLLCPVSMVAPFDVGVRWGDARLSATPGASLRRTACVTAGVARCLMGLMLCSMPSVSARCRCPETISVTLVRGQVGGGGRGRAL